MQFRILIQQPDSLYSTPVCQSTGTNPTTILNAGFNTGGTFSSTNPGLVFVSNSTGEIDLINSTPGTYQVVYTYSGDVANCINSGTSSATLVINVSTPATFTQIPTICQNATAPVLPTTSTNGVNGTWNPATINTSVAGTSTYTFTPNAGECGTGTTMNITVDTNITPSFTPINDLCIGATPPSLPTTSNNGITGTWNPSVISTTSAGTFNYTFTPDAGQCASPVVVSVLVNNNVMPVFTQIEPICVGEQPVTLNLISNNGISGTWTPSSIDTTQSGTFVYTFTPNDPTQCAASTTMTVQVVLCTIQKGISPNGDGLNDYLKLSAQKVEIFNRYGKEVYSKSSYVNDWHGQSNGGSVLPDGTYYYVIELYGGEVKTGWIYINKED